jgi:hypothetical protein
MYMPVRISIGKYREFRDNLMQHEVIHGPQDVNSIRNLARTFARTKSPEDDRAAQPIYWSCFSTICHDRNITLPDNFNFDNPYDPDGIFPANDINIRKKLRRDALNVLRRTEDLLDEIGRRDVGLLQ